MQFFFQELYSHIGEEFEDMFLVKIASKETSLTLSLGCFSLDDFCAWDAYKKQNSKE